MPLTLLVRTAASRSAASRQPRSVTSQLRRVAWRARRSPTALSSRSPAHRLSLYQRGTLVRSYLVALGQQPVGDKVRIGDKRTPEGLFRIEARNPAEPLSSRAADLVSRRGASCARARAWRFARRRHHDSWSACSAGVGRRRASRLRLDRGMHCRHERGDRGDLERRTGRHSDSDQAVAGRERGERARECPADRVGRRAPLGAARSSRHAARDRSGLDSYSDVVARWIGRHSPRGTIRCAARRMAQRARSTRVDTERLSRVSRSWVSACGA